MSHSESGSPEDRPLSSEVGTSPRDDQDRSVGPYQLVELLGRGGMGSVYRGYDPRLDRSVALKQIRAEAAESPRAHRRFRREARAVARLSHPNVVKVHDLLSTDNRDWIVMELVNGRSLASELAGGPLPLSRGLELATEIASALVAAHAEGIVHRDLKANNVLVNEDGHAKVLDFGLAKQVVNPRDTTSISIEGHLIGTPHAMSPEQAMGRKVDLRSDLFSFGTLLYEIVTGISPFRAGNPVEVLDRICTHQPQSLEEFVEGGPAELSELVERLLEKDPRHRPQTAREVVADLRRVVRVLSRAPAERQARPVTPPVRVQDSRSTVDGPRLPSGEQRQVTVMCCELTGLDTSSGSLDSSELAEAMSDWEAFVRDEVECYEGYVASVLGHRAVAYFGYPLAHEDDATRAAWAGLDMLSGVGGRLGVELGLCIGIHTGPAVVLEDPGEEIQLAAGPTLDLAYEVQRQAVPGQLLVSDAARPLLRRVFETKTSKLSRSLGDSIEICQLIKPFESQSFWQDEFQRVPMIARRNELELLLQRWQLVLEGKKQAVWISGEAGIGKSRLSFALREELQDEADWIEIQCSSYAQNSPLFPILEALKRLIFGRTEEELAEEPIARMERWLELQGLDTTRYVPLLALALELSLDGQGYQPPALSPQKLRAETLAAVAAVFQLQPKQRPRVLVVEDLHWGDPSTVEFLGLLVESVDALPFFLILTSRLEFEPPWAFKDGYTHLYLDRLSGEEALAMIESFAAGKSLPEEVARLILSKTDGVPLFVEELLNHFVGSGLLIEKSNSYELQANLGEVYVPGTLRDSLMARLDSMGSAKAVAQLASVVGREVSYDLLNKVLPATESSVLEGELNRLVEARLLKRKGFARRKRFLFKHALIQDVAYGSMLSAQKKEYHLRISGVIKEDFPQVAQTRPEVLALHFTRGESFEQGIEYWHRAGQHASRRFAVQEATHHIERGIDLLSRLSSGRIRQEYELKLHYTLGSAKAVKGSHATAEAKEAFQHALSICRSETTVYDRFWALFGLWRSNLTQGLYSEAEELAHQLLVLSDSSEAPTDFVVTANTLIGITHFGQGNFRYAAPHLEKAVALDSAERCRPFEMPDVSEDQGVGAFWFHGLNLWFLGMPDQAKEQCEQALALARRIRDPYSVGHALVGAFILSRLLGDFERTYAYSQDAIALGREQDSWWGAPGQIYSSWAQVHLQEGSKSIFHLQELERALDFFYSTGMRSMVTKMFAVFAEAAIHKGHLRKAESALARAEEEVRRSGERFFSAELLRLRGRIDLSRRLEDSAENRFNKALTVSREQGSKSLELRAASDLSRLYRRQKRYADGRALLKPIFSSFTEGFGSRDLLQARRLLSAPS